MRKLECLNLSYNDIVDFTPLKVFSKTGYCLKKLDIRGNENCNKKALFSSLTGIRTLKSLMIGMGQSFPDNQKESNALFFQGIFDKIPSLIEVDSFYRKDKLGSTIGRNLKQGKQQFFVGFE